jgi:hypothetical protein
LQCHGTERTKKIFLHVYFNRKRLVCQAFEVWKEFKMVHKTENPKSKLYKTAAEALMSVYDGESTYQFEAIVLLCSEYDNAKFSEQREVEQK